MSDKTVDIIDELAGISPGTALDELRRRRPVTLAQLQASHDALFVPLDDADFTLAERLLVAAFATRLTANDETAAHYADRALAIDPERGSVVIAEAAAQTAGGPFGRYHEDGLASESTDGPRYAADTGVVVSLGAHLAAALEHAHLLVYRPREAAGHALDRLLDAGWSVDGIVTLSQLVAFLAFQQRVAAGLRVLGAEVSA
jgi:CMD domain protein